MNSHLRLVSVCTAVIGVVAGGMWVQQDSKPFIG